MEEYLIVMKNGSRKKIGCLYLTMGANLKHCKKCGAAMVLCPIVAPCNAHSMLISCPILPSRSIFLWDWPPLPLFWEVRDEHSVTAAQESKSNMCGKERLEVRRGDSGERIRKVLEKLFSPSYNSDLTVSGWVLTIENEPCFILEMLECSPITWCRSRQMIKSKVS